jgi:ABC-2 type transport system permease protein
LTDRVDRAAPAREPSTVLGGLEATLAIAKVAAIRTRRGRSIWVVIGLSVLPLAFAAILRDRELLSQWGRVMSFWAYFLAILPPVLLASAIGEEIEERTMTYLWSRPLPRWSIIAGKFVALIPILWVVLAVSILAPLVLLFPDLPDRGDLAGRAILAAIVGTTAAAAVTAGITTLAPRYGTILSLAYLMFIDRTFAWWDWSIGKLSVTYHALRVSGAYGHAESLPVAIAWLTGIVLVWMAVAVVRVRSLE